MCEEERPELIEGTDEDGNQLLLTVEKYFFYNGDEYVLLKAYEDPDGESEADAAPAPEATASETLYVMKVSVSADEDGEEIEEFEPVDEELAQRLIPVIRSRWQMPELGEAKD